MRVSHYRNAPQVAGPVDQPGMQLLEPGSYFPDSRVASNANGDSYNSPLSYPGAAGPAPYPTDILSLPRGGESPWIITVQSDEQGVGRSPGQQWPWTVRAEAYNFEPLAYVPFEWEQTGAVSIPGGWSESTDMRTGPERQGWPWQPGNNPYFEQSEGFATNPDSVAVLSDPQQAAYTIGWGYIGDDGGAGTDYEAYG